MKTRLLTSIVLLALALFALAPLTAQVVKDPPKVAAPVFDYAPFDKILKAHVNADGSVDYAQLAKKNRKALDRYLKGVEQFDAKKLRTRAERIAFYVNAYNAHVLREVLKTGTPAKVLDVKGFFDQRMITVARQKYTLNALEKIVRDEGDPRVHFIVNCASASCPKLEGRAFRAATLEASLVAATRRYLADTKHGLAIDPKKGVAKASKIFEWYAKDFHPSGSPAKVLAWIREHAPVTQKAGLMKVKKLAYLEYDWKLNRAKAR